MGCGNNAYIWAYLLVCAGDICLYFLFRGDILGVIAHAAVLTNAGLITFTMDVFDNHSTGYKLWFFILFQWTCYAFQVSTLILLHIIATYVTSGIIDRH